MSIWTLRHLKKQPKSETFKIQFEISYEIQATVPNLTTCMLHEKRLAFEMLFLIKTVFQTVLTVYILVALYCSKGELDKME